MRKYILLAAIFALNCANATVGAATAESGNSKNVSRAEVAAITAAVKSLMTALWTQGVYSPLYQVIKSGDEYKVTNADVSEIVASIQGIESAYPTLPNGYLREWKLLGFWWDPNAQLDQADPNAPDPKKVSPDTINLLRALKQKYNNKPRFLIIIKDETKVGDNIIDTRYYVAATKNELASENSWSGQALSFVKRTLEYDQAAQAQTIQNIVSAVDTLLGTISRILFIKPAMMVPYTNTKLWKGNIRDLFAARGEDLNNRASGQTTNKFIEALSNEKSQPAEENWNWIGTVEKK